MRKFIIASLIVAGMAPAAFAQETAETKEFVVDGDGVTAFDEYGAALTLLGGAAVIAILTNSDSDSSSSTGTTN